MERYTTVQIKIIARINVTTGLYCSPIQIKDVRTILKSTIRVAVSIRFIFYLFKLLTIALTILFVIV
jgi:hypothetical protein